MPVVNFDFHISTSSSRKAPNWTVARSCFVLARSLKEIWTPSRPSPTSTSAETIFLAGRRLGLRPGPCRATPFGWPPSSCGFNWQPHISLERVKNMEPQSFFVLLSVKIGGHGCRCRFCPSWLRRWHQAVTICCCSKVQRIFPQIPSAIGFFLPIGGGERRTTLADWTWQAGCQCWAPWWGVMVGCHCWAGWHCRVARCYCRVLWWEGGEDQLWRTGRGAMVECHCCVPLIRAVVAVPWWHCWLSGGCHGGVLSTLADLQCCHCRVPWTWRTLSNVWSDRKFLSIWFLIPWRIDFFQAQSRTPDDKVWLCL